MKGPTFAKGAIAGVVLCGGAAVGLSVFTLFFVFPVAAKLLVMALAGGYVAYLLTVSASAVGRITTLTLWLAASVVAWLFGLPLIEFVTVQLIAIWLVRSLYFHSGLLTALLDLGLLAVGVALALWTYAHTGSPLLSLWCFFLVQALFVTIPTLEASVSRTRAGVASQDSNADFEQARRRAETAVQELMTR